MRPYSYVRRGVLFGVGFLTAAVRRGSPDPALVRCGSSSVRVLFDTGLLTPPKGPTAGLPRVEETFGRRLGLSETGRNRGRRPA